MGQNVTTITPQRVHFMGCPLDRLTQREMLSRIEHAIHTRSFLQHGMVNVAKLVKMKQDESLWQDVTESDLITADGMGIVWGARLCGYAMPERVNGTDLMERLLALCEQRGWRPYVLGASPEVLEQAIRTLQLRHPRLQFAGWHHGYYSKEEERSVMETVRDAKPDCLLVAMTSPLKERIMRQYRGVIQVPFIMGVGGSIDVVAGKVRRAPLWMQRNGLEWFWRMLQEPRRLGKRYLVSNSYFLFLLAGEICRLRVWPRVAHAV